MTMSIPLALALAIIVGSFQVGMLGDKDYLKREITDNCCTMYIVLYCSALLIEFI